MTGSIGSQSKAVLVDDPGKRLVRLQVRNVRVDVLTGIYSEETHKPQPLDISIVADLPVSERFTPETPLTASVNYLDLRRAMKEALPADVHFKLIESVADHICDTIFLQEPRIVRIEVEIVKALISVDGELIGMTLVRNR